MKHDEHSLPWDYARCFGVKEPVCEKCLRRTPGHPTRQTYMTPPIKEGKCGWRIAKEART